MENQKQFHRTNSDESKFPKRIWLFALVGLVDFFAYFLMLFVNLPLADWWSTLSGTAVLLMVIGTQGISFALLGTALLVAAKNSLVKKGFNFKRIFILNAIGFFLLGSVPLIVFLPSNQNSDYAMGMALLPVFVYPFFNVIRFFILLAATFFFVRVSRSS